MSRVLMGVYEQLEAGGEGRGITTLPVGADPACRTQVFTQTLSSSCQQIHLDMDSYDLKRWESIPMIVRQWQQWGRDTAFSSGQLSVLRKCIFMSVNVFCKVNYQKVSLQYCIVLQNRTYDNNSSNQASKTVNGVEFSWVQSYLLKVVLSYMEMHDQVYQQQCVDSTLVCTYIGNDLWLRMPKDVVKLQERSFSVDGLKSIVSFLVSSLFTKRALR